MQLQLSPTMTTGPKGYVKILEKLAEMLEKLLNTPEKERERIANMVSDYCAESIYNVKDDRVEDILVSCLDLDHWGWKELPPSLTIDDIRNEVLPEVRKLIKLLRKRC